MLRYPSASVERMDKQFAETEAERNERLRKKRRMRPRLCEDCGVNPADAPGDLCPGCEAYRGHTGHF